MLTPINVPPGVFRNGTELEQAGRWRDASLVRWHDGVMRPIGGWRERGVDIFGADGDAVLVNEEFTGDISGWTDTSGATASASWAGGELVLTTSATNRSAATQTFQAVVGRTYRIEVEITTAVAAQSSFHIGSTENANDVLNESSLGVGTHTFFFTATSVTTYVRLLGAFPGSVGDNTISYCRIREDSQEGEFPPRAMLSWQANDASRQYAVGTAEHLFAVNSGGTIYDITPSGFTAGRSDATAKIGYGMGPYGAGLYGMPRPDTGDSLEASTWHLDTWGEYLVGCMPDDGKLYEWQLNTSNPAAVISNAPTDCRGLMVTEERFLFAFAADGNPRKIAWSDREDNTTWTDAPTNEAGSIELQTSGKIMLGARTKGQSLILTDQDAHAFTYIGPPFVYGRERVGTGCGAISQMCAASVDPGVIWMGDRSFFIYSGGTVAELPCEVSDYVFTGINRAQRSKIWAVRNAQWGEIWWFYPSSTATECDRYVAFNYNDRTWMIGEMSRTAGVDAGVYRYPLWSDANGVIYEQEVGYAHGASTPFAETGPFMLGAGNNVMSVVDMIPDEDTQGEVTVTFKTRYHPNGAETAHGPYNLSNPTSVRFTGRQARMRADSAVIGDWRFGVQRLDVREGGRR